MPDISSTSFHSDLYNAEDAVGVENALGAIIGDINSHSDLVNSGVHSGFSGELLEGATVGRESKLNAPIDVTGSLHDDFSYTIVSEKPMCVDSNGVDRSYGECWTKEDDRCQVCTCYNTQEVRCSARQCDPEPICRSGQRKELQSDDGCCTSYRCVDGKRV